MDFLSIMSSFLDVASKDARVSQSREFKRLSVACKKGQYLKIIYNDKSPGRIHVHQEVMEDWLREIVQAFKDVEQALDLAVEIDILEIAASALLALSSNR